MEGLVGTLLVTVSSWQRRGCRRSAKAKDSPLPAHGIGDSFRQLWRPQRGWESGFRGLMICGRLSPSCPAKLGCKGVGGIGLGRHVSVDVCTSAAPGNKGPTSVGTAGTGRMSLKLPCGHGILLASPREKGPRGQGHGFKAVAHVRCSFLLLSSFSSYIPCPSHTRWAPST